MLLIVAKAPIAGQAKTRLAKHIGYEAAAALYRCFLLDTLAAAKQVPGVEVALAYVPTPGAEAILRPLADGVPMVPQQGANLGERLDHLLTTYLQRGYTGAAVLSSDVPLVDPLALAAGFAALDNGYDVAFGPCDDGGYYLLASRSPCPMLFAGIEMSTPTVAAQTLAAAERAGLRVAMLSPTSDIDPPADLERLHEVLEAAGDEVAVHTRGWLERQGGAAPCRGSPSPTLWGQGERGS